MKPEPYDEKMDVNAERRLSGSDEEVKDAGKETC